MEHDSPVLITISQGTAILSSMKFSMIISPILAAWMMERYIFSCLNYIYGIYFWNFHFRFGRKTTLLYGAVLLLTGWIIIALAESFPLLIVFAFLVASALSISEAVLPSYIAEISSAHIRGYLGVLFTVMGKMGLLLMYAVGPFVSIRQSAWLCTIPVSLFIAIYFLLPESPYFLIAKNQIETAEINLQRLRCSHDVKEELAQMELSVKESEGHQGTIRELFLHPRNRRNFIVVVGLSGVVELSGSQIVLQYAQTIFATLDTGLDTKYASIIFGIVQLFAAILTCFFVDTVGRRPLLLISIVGSGLCTLVIAIYFILERHMDVTGIGWIPLTAIMVFMVTYSVGMVPLMYVLTSELFPKHLRGVAGATLVINGNWIGLVLIHAYQYGLDVWGSDYVFMAFSLVTFAFVPFVWFLVPETTRKTLENILKDESNKNNAKL